MVRVWIEHGMNQQSSTWLFCGI